MSVTALVASKLIKKKLKQKKHEGAPNNKPNVPIAPERKQQIADTLKKTVNMGQPDNKPKKKSSFDESLHKFKEFIVSPTGIVVVIGLIILGHYAWKGFKAEGGKGK